MLKEKKMGDKVYMTVPAASEYLGLCPNTIRSYCKSREKGKAPRISHIRIGCNFFFEKKWLDDFIMEKSFTNGHASGEMNQLKKKEEA